MEASLQSTSANSEMAYRYWSSVEYKTVGQSTVADPGGGMPGCIPPHQLDTIIYAGIYWRTGATVVVSV
jgi:hypothetical protein